ncbi:MAG: hypothetical protein IPM25_00315 [Chloracidobacterium sp.]|nr:hypothetical protein [Chloracidobacterium sp.]
MASDYSPYCCVDEHNRDGHEDFAFGLIELAKDKDRYSIMIFHNVRGKNNAPAY